MTKQMWRPMGLTALMTLGVTLAGCGMQGRMPVLQSALPAALPMARALDAATDLEKAFRADAAKHGVNLTDAQFAQIKVERKVMPIGTFANRPAENLTPEQNLNVHFLKHGKEFPGLATQADYLAAAIAFDSGKKGPVNFYFDTTSYAKGYQTHVVRWGAASHEFSAVRADGAVTTYYRNDRVDAKRFVPVPAF